MPAISRSSDDRQYWRCQDCACLNRDHETFCFRCGAGQPEDDEVDHMPDIERSSDDYAARLDDAIHEINQRWGEPIGGEDDPLDMVEMDQALVRETAEAVIAPWRAEVERLRGRIEQLDQALMSCAKERDSANMQVTRFEQATLCALRDLEAGHPGLALDFLRGALEDLRRERAQMWERLLPGEIESSELLRRHGEDISAQEKDRAED